ncbi:Ankyrin repeat-containing domain [Phytophthora cactorum]|nr:Ankyrin repeat-containing domain [Phytophthora cactorum]
MMRSLLEDEQFLQQLKAKLGLTSRSRPVSRATARSGRRSLVFEDEEDENDARRVDLNDEMAALEDEAMDRSKSALISAKIAKLQLQLPQTRAKASQPVNHRGEGWKRLKTSRLPPNFARSVYKTHTEGPRSSFINQTNHATPVGMLDPQIFIPELRAHFVPRPSEDLHEKKRQWAELLRTQQTSGTPTSSAIRRGAVSEQIEARALLCARNNNLEGLELALDQGVDVNARDNHGNTLFILACQQGNKPDMNLQNLNGNTALHYLYAYKHKDLADYLKAKGAKDTTQNAAGLTCYEGLSQDDVDGI